MSDNAVLRNLGLTPFRVLLMHRLNAGPEKDCVGLEMNEMTPRELQAVGHLTGAKLAEVVPGWRSTFWYRLTPRGRQILRMLSAIVI